MVKRLVLAMMVAGLPALMAGSAAAQQAPATPKIRMAQACWYAILACSNTSGEARAWSNRHGVGRVINTSSDEFPNFRAGYYCVVIGPMGAGQAQATARSYRGISPTSYAKSGC